MEKSCGTCTKCCQAIHINKNTKLKGRFPKGSDQHLIVTSWKRISVRIAKKINPHIFNKKYHGNKEVSAKKRTQFFFKCKNLRNYGCSIYETRPQICSGYPYYKEEPKQHHGKDYHENCVYILEIQ